MKNYIQKYGSDSKADENPRLRRDKLNLVMFNMSSYFDWDHGVVNRNHNILQALAKEEYIEKIVAVDFLPIGFKRTAAHYVKNILWEPKNQELIYGDLTSACWRKSDKIYVYSSIDSFFSYKIVAKELRRIEKILNLKNIVFWSFNPMFTEFIGKLNEKLFVFDTVDNWSLHPSYTKMMSKRRLKKNYQTIADKADLIFTVADELKQFYSDMKRTKDVHWIPNGVDFDHFNNPANIKKDNKLKNITKPIVGYLGTIEERVDLDLIARVAKNHKDKIIALCGPVWPSIKPEFKKKLGKLENVLDFGRIPFDEAPSYVQTFNVTMIPHKLNQFVDTMNPMKMYDYLACGKPIVATSGAGINMFKEHIYIADDPEKFSEAIDQALAEDSPKKQEARQDAVKPHSWLARSTKMTELVYEKLKSK